MLAMENASKIAVLLPNAMKNQQVLPGHQAIPALGVLQAVLMLAIPLNPAPILSRAAPVIMVAMFPAMSAAG